MATQPPNVLFLLSDEHAFRYQSWLDPDGPGEPVDTPTIDDLATTGTAFEQAYCQAPLCTPSRMCLLTGREVQRCGAWSNGSVMRKDVPTMPGTFASAGYETCLVGKMHFGGDRQFNGFEHRPYGDLTGQHGHQREPIKPEDRHPDWTKHLIADAGVTEIPESLLQEQSVVQESVAFLREHRHANPDQPWFLCASFSRPHPPLTAPSRFFDRYWPQGVTAPTVDREGDTAGHPLTKHLARKWRLEEGADRVLPATQDEQRRARAAYFACVDFLDEILGDLLVILERDGFLENTIIVYASDHGELAGEHGLFWKHAWYEAATRVPWSIQLPDHRTGDRQSSLVRTPVSLADLFPTLCGLAGVPTPDSLDGDDLSNAVRTGEEPDRGPVYCDMLSGTADGDLDYRMVRDGRYKYVQFADAPEVLVDLEGDPLELTNLAGDEDHVDVLHRLRALVDAELDFETIAKERTADGIEAEQRALPIPGGSSSWNATRSSHCNAYLLPDGRLVNAESTLYKPDVLADDPPLAFDDWPGN